MSAAGWRRGRAASAATTVGRTRRTGCLGAAAATSPARAYPATRRAAACSPTTTQRGPSTSASPDGRSMPRTTCAKALTRSTRPDPHAPRLLFDSSLWLEQEGFDAWIDGGDVRWVRPGRWYGPEYTNDGCTILAMHPSFGGSGDCRKNADGDCVSADGFEGSWVSWTKPPPGPYVTQYTVTETRTYDESNSTT
jgi:hypothetical protein